MSGSDVHGGRVQSRLNGHDYAVMCCTVLSGAVGMPAVGRAREACGNPPSASRWSKLVSEPVSVGGYETEATVSGLRSL